VSGGAGEQRIVLGLDIGGTKLAAGPVTHAGEPLAWERGPSDAAAGPDRVIERLVELARLSLRRANVSLGDVAAIGVGCGGPLDAERGVITNALNNPGWIDVPLKRILEDALGRPVHVENDANAAALGEQRFGAGRGVSNLVYVTVSTGIGGGVIIGGNLYRGENGNAGEIGHIAVEYGGRLCHCGGHGCLEAYASGTNIAIRAREALVSEEPSLLLDLAGTPDRITAETVSEAVRQGDAVATRVWDETTTILAAGVASVINAFNPRLVVIGGGVTRAGELFFEPVRRKALARVMAPLAQVAEIVPSALGDRLGVIGAAAVALEREPSP
jgi:glucokinase